MHICSLNLSASIIARKQGKLVDILSADYDICARVAGGSNAGHTIVVDKKKYKFHLVPSGDVTLYDTTSFVNETCLK